MPDSVVHLRPRRPCPICKKQSAQKFHPFCSSRCAQIDLNRWFGGNYAIPVEEDDTPDKDDGPVD